MSRAASPNAYLLDFTSGKTGGKGKFIVMKFPPLNA